MQISSPHYYVYIFGSPASDNLKVGVAGDLQKQLQEISKEPASQNMTVVKEKPRLVYYEHYEREEIARNREQEILKGGDDNVQRLIESMNPNWLDLSDMIS
ncbi:GIY-YIG nuclease family protein [Pontibacter saemangeumensis]|uniref:GIY-YIG nuclease family protein n=1 Tax=Pontibacter saemangeumensis TaxID=1084525 RepID=A0ABP8LEL1_9BACT